MVSSKVKVFMLLLIFLIGSGIVYMKYYFNCFFIDCSQLKYTSFLQHDEAYANDMNVNTSSFDLEGEDVLVFLHIQKTGGTFFGRNLVRNLDMKPPCICGIKNRKRCDCFTRNKKIWLFSRYSTGWICGLHADWTELQSCVDKKMDEKEGRHRKRRYHYITYLRDPIHRYISEWKHVKRGATWKSTRLFCKGKEASIEEVPFCYEDSDWKNVSLEEFLSCPHNLASNRQTRMLSDLTKVNCYNISGMSQEERDTKMLDSAKQNLRSMSYFGLTEYQNYSQYLFESTFNLPFVEDFEQKSRTVSSQFDFNPFLKRIQEKNHLDIKLYEYAKKLFSLRVHNRLNVTFNP